ncbi:hypothetical protein [Streptosporangium sp. NPDC004631]
MAHLPGMVIWTRWSLVGYGDAERGKAALPYRLYGVGRLTRFRSRPSPAQPSPVWSGLAQLDLTRLSLA